MRGNAGGLAAIEANFAVDGLAFSDVSGLHAGENISGEITAKAMRQARSGSEVYGNGRLMWTWPQGEVFWQPLYFTAQGHHLHVNGELDDNIIRLLKGNLVLAGIGEADLSGVIDRSSQHGARS